MEDLWLLAFLALMALVPWLAWGGTAHLPLIGLFATIAVVKLSFRQWRWFPSQDPEDYR